MVEVEAMDPPFKEVVGFGGDATDGTFIPLGVRNLRVALLGAPTDSKQPVVDQSVTKTPPPERRSLNCIELEVKLIAGDEV